VKFNLGKMTICCTILPKGASVSCFFILYEIPILTISTCLNQIIETGMLKDHNVLKRTSTVSGNTSNVFCSVIEGFDIKFIASELIY